jgi:hypothetical protein
LIASGFTENSESSVNSLGFHVSSDSSEFGDDGSFSDREVTSVLGVGGGNLFGSSVVDISLLWLTFLKWEDNKFGLVADKSSNVDLELFNRGVGASVINGDSDSACPFLGHFGTLELGEGETTSISDLTSIFTGGRRDNGSELLNGSREACLCFSLSLMKSCLLLLSLIEVSVYSLLPMFTEMDVGNDVVVLDHCLLYIQ